MPFVLILIGITLVIVGVRNKQDQFFALLKNDFSGPDSFVPWIASLFFIGAIGYIKPLKPLSNAFLVLVIIVLFLSNGGFFAKFNQQLGIK